jgi:hypothetical protein
LDICSQISLIWFFFFLLCCSNRVNLSYCLQVYNSIFYSFTLGPIQWVLLLYLSVLSFVTLKINFLLEIFWFKMWLKKIINFLKHFLQWQVFYLHIGISWSSFLIQVMVSWDIDKRFSVWFYTSYVGKSESYKNILLS